ncbi:MAG: BlaI/MecI/CopY family transcriptional regulator [Gammaproteobacteria bacterium]|nr:BlaI/MecI/CopY family transcriptional regulator [Gammaproteobacteria bacterium]MCW5584134.1 BlaI/MecI/CopY family transcriptional regulator [Gammaproteobacteria bacterium]
MEAGTAYGFRYSKLYPAKTGTCYTSLLTLVQTMEKKGYIKHGKAFAYLPILKQEKFLISEVKRIAKRLFEGSPGKLVLNLVENKQLSQTEIEALKKL